MTNSLFPGRSGHANPDRSVRRARNAPVENHSVNGRNYPLVGSRGAHARSQSRDNFIGTSTGQHPISSDIEPAPRDGNVSPSESTTLPRGERIMLQTPVAGSTVRARSGYALIDWAIRWINVPLRTMRRRSAASEMIAASQGMDGRDSHSSSATSSNDTPQQRQFRGRRAVLELGADRREQELEQRRQSGHQMMRGVTDIPYPHASRPRIVQSQHSLNREEGRTTQDLEQRQQDRNRMMRRMTDTPHPHPSRLRNELPHFVLERQAEVRREEQRRTESRVLRQQIVRERENNAVLQDLQSIAQTTPSSLPIPVPTSSPVRVYRDYSYSSPNEREILSTISSSFLSTRETAPSSIDVRFRGLLAHFHSQAAIPTPPSRPFHGIPRYSRITSDEPMATIWAQLRAEAVASVTSGMATATTAALASARRGRQLMLAGATRGSLAARISEIESTSRIFRTGSDPYRSIEAYGSFMSFPHATTGTLVSPTRQRLYSFDSQGSPEEELLEQQYVMEQQRQLEEQQQHREQPQEEATRFPSTGREGIAGVSAELAAQFPTRPEALPPLTRAILEQYSSCRVTNPDGLPWYSLTLLIRVHNLRLQRMAEAQAHALAQRIEGAQEERRRREAVLEAARVEQAVTNLALCNALSDSRAVLAQVEDAEEEIDCLEEGEVSMSGEGEQRRGWVMTEQIMTTTEMNLLREGIARRDLLGVDLGLLDELEDMFGSGYGRWAYDVWVAQAIRPFLRASDSSSARVGAVWLETPVLPRDQHRDQDGEQQDNDVDDLGAFSGGGDDDARVREWHVILEDEDAPVGDGEGWFELREVV